MSEKNSSFIQWLDYLTHTGLMTAALVGAAVGWHQYLDKLDSDRKAREAARDGELEARRKEYEMKYYDKQLEAYMELCEVVCRMAYRENLAESARDSNDRP